MCGRHLGIVLLQLLRHAFFSCALLMQGNQVLLPQGLCVRDTSRNVLGSHNDTFCLAVRPRLQAEHVCEDASRQTVRPLALLARSPTNYAPNGQACLLCAVQVNIPPLMSRPFTVGSANILLAKPEFPLLHHSVTLLDHVAGARAVTLQNELELNLAGQVGGRRAV